MNKETSNETKQIDVFLALPCAEVFTEVNDCIKGAFIAANTNPIVIEDRAKTTFLWEEIVEKIDSAQYFVADISSLSPSVMLELGYTIKQKDRQRIAVLISKNIEVPSDIRWLKYIKYGTMTELKRNLVKWIKDNIPCVDSQKLECFKIENREYQEDFWDFDRFHELWYCPPGSQFHLTSEGLHFTNAHFPIMTTHFALFQNYEFEFKARIDRNLLGWVVKGTRERDTYSPTFCIMFNIDQDCFLTPHILNIDTVREASGYQDFERKEVLLVRKEGWFTLTTKVIDDRITIFNNGKEIFRADFNAPPYRRFYETPYKKQGEIGFRCFGLGSPYDERSSFNEEATVGYVKLREIEK